MAGRDARIADLQREVKEKTDWATALDKRGRELEQQVQDRDVRLVILERERDAARASWGYRWHQRLAPWARRLRRILVGLVRAVGFLLLLAAQLILALPKTPRFAMRLWQAINTLFIAGRLRGLLVANLPEGRSPEERPTPHEGSPPGVSVVIPSYQGLALLEKYFSSVVAETKRCSFATEIIVVDDGGADETPTWLARNYPPVRVLRLEQNSGFGAAANAGVKAASHPLVFLCNNDMELKPGAIEHAATTLWRTGAFAVASAIEMTDETNAGTETGLTTATWQTGGLTINHRGDLGQRPRSTLYAGGGAAAFDRAAFLALGGFADLYHPFYAEDLDLSYRAWKAGWTVLVEPRSRVAHQHRGTIGRVTGRREIETMLARNLLLFVWTNVVDDSLLDEHCETLWKEVLLGRLSGRAVRDAWRKRTATVAARRARWTGFLSDRELMSGAGSAAWDRQRTPKTTPRRSDGRLKVLAVAPYCPYPPTHGGAVRMWELLTRLAKKHEVHLAAMVEREQELEAEATLRQHFPRVHLHLRGRPDAAPAWWPASVAEFKADDFERAIDRLCGEEDYDLVQVEYPILAHALPRFGRAKRVIAEIDVYHISYRRAAAVAATWRDKLLATYEWLRMFRYEAEHADQADLLLAMSEPDAQACRELTATPVRVAPNGVDTARIRFSPRVERPREVLFVGHFRHPPNVESVTWFAANVWPRVRDANWRARLLIAGAQPPPVVEALGHDPTITVTGFVPDLTPLYQQAACFVVPVRRGSGTRLKILEAMAAGVPVLSTKIGAEGIKANDGEHLLLADEPEEMAHACLRLLAEAELRDRLAANARALVEREYDWGIIADRLDAAWREVTR